MLPEDLGEDAVAAVKANAVERIQSLRLSSIKSLTWAGRSSSSFLGSGGKGHIRIDLGGELPGDKALELPGHALGPAISGIPAAETVEAVKAEHVVLACVEQSKPQAPLEAVFEEDSDSKWGASWFDQVR